MADIFGRNTGSVYESGLIDAENEEKFDNMLTNLKKRWSACHGNGLQFYEWFCEYKREEFLTSAINPVGQRAGLGCPPERLTTNRSEQTNHLLQEFVRAESNGKKNIDEFSFCVALRKIVNTQKQEIELAVLGRGEYRLCKKFKFLEVTAAVVKNERRAESESFEESSSSHFGSSNHFFCFCYQRCP